MIPLKRDRTATAIADNFKSPKRERFETELMEDQRSIRQGQLNKHDFDSGRWKKAKDELIKDSNSKCAYCEAPTTVVAYGDVEHFRPKSKYWWLAYCYDNYLVSCQLCNQKYKKAKFSIKNSQLSVPVRITRNTTDNYIQSRAGQLGPNPLAANDVAAFEASHRQERPYLVNPYIDDPVNFYAWKAFDSLKRVKLVAKPGLADAGKYVKAAEEDLGLNRVELQELRYETLNTYRLLKRFLTVPGIPAQLRADTQDEIARMKSDEGRFAGMLRFFDP